MTGPSAAPQEETTGAVPRAWEVIGTIVAPTTLLTALLFYFGLLYSVGYYRYFGVNVTVLELPVQGVLTLSASTAVLPLGLLAATVLLSTALLRLPLDRLTGRRRRVARRAGVPAVASCGVVLVALAALDALAGLAPFPRTFPEARGLALAVGVLLLVYAGRVRRTLDRPRPPRPAAPALPDVARWAGVFVLVGIGLFWAVGSYAVRVGGADARGFAGAHRCTAEVVLYSERSLNLGHSGAVEEPGPADAAYGVRYPGLRLVPQSGPYYLLLPPGWSAGERPAIVLPRSAAVRLEFLAPRAC